MTRAGWRDVARTDLPAVLVSLAAGLLLLGPGLRGVVLVRDLVIVPDPAVTARLLGLGHETPRGVPSDLVAALLTRVLGAPVTSVVLLLGALVVAGWGASRLVGPRQPARCAAAAVAVWNPYVAERLAMGHWALLLGYAALPWVLVRTADLLTGRGTARPVVVAVLAASLGGAVAWLLALVALAATALATRPEAPARRRSVPVVLAVVAGALPWLVPTLARPRPPVSDAVGFDVFGPHADLPVGTVLSVLTGGGIWNDAVVPAGRDSAVGAVLALVVLAVAAAGWGLAGRPSPVERAVLVAGAFALLLVGAGAALAHVDVGVPGAGLLRDGTRSLGPWLLVLAVGCGRAVRAGLTRGLPVAAASLAVLLPVAVLPGAAWGVGGRLAPTDLPPAVAAAERTVDVGPEDATVVVLPFTPVRSYPWNGGRTSLTPWSRVLDARVVTGSGLRVSRPDGTVVVPGDDPLADAVARALASPDPRTALQGAGVRWVLVDAGAPPAWAAGAPDLGDGVRLLPLDPDPAAATATARFDPPPAAVLAGDVAALVLAGLGLATAGRRRVRQPMPTIG